MSINRTSLYNSLSRLYLICLYLREYREKIGQEAYKDSYIRAQHSTGRNWFNIDSGGDTDNLSATVRGVTDKLNQRNQNISGIDFRSQSCIGAKNYNRSVQRVEHATPVKGLFLQIEKEFIIGDRPISIPELASYILLTQIVTLIETTEQIKFGNEINEEKPFSRYSAPIFYQGTDVSQFSLKQLKEINLDRYSSILSEIYNKDFTAFNHKNKLKLFTKVDMPGKHTIPPMDFAIQYAVNEFELLHQYYHYKRDKVIDPSSPRFHAVKAKQYQNWLENKVKEQSI